jgi:Zn-dependent M28 family amino/carboxypeptidase
MRDRIGMLPVIIYVLLVTACGEDKTTKADVPVAGINIDSLTTSIKELSADSFLGRKPFTQGEAITVDYLHKKFAGMGLEPGNGNSYFQDVPMVNIMATASPTMQVQSSKGKFSLKGFDDYAIWTDRTDSIQSFNNDELIFAGYGVVAPEYNWNDYAGIDVKGKVVLVLVNDPGFNSGDTTLFKGKTMTYYGRWTYKFEEAARQGAKGCLIIHSTVAASYPFGVQQANHNTSRLQLDNRGKPQEACNIIGWISSPATNRLLKAAGMDSTLLSKADQRGFKAISLNLKMSTGMTIKTTYSNSKNVIAKITGSKYPDETIIYTAHWDHFGIAKPDEKGDSIYNGAYDNASGTAGLFEIARAFKSLPAKPERTIIFLAVTAEEQGLWGSAYYAQNPVYPLEKTVANINMDGLSKYGKTKEVVVVGKGQSELEDLIKAEAEKQGRHLGDEAHPEAGYYYRSDHFNFAKGGVPSLHFDEGLDMEGKTREEVKKMQDDYTAKNYHQPSDEYTNDWNLEGAIEDLVLYFRLGDGLANNRIWPAWKQGSEFKALRDKTNDARK